ncbi:MAG: aminotransferase class III-fold pyridoxal phosphate-dependent enzyme [Chlorobi bacterium]|nr:aminotransferase class III-fold pyridoxal phosphate-dependent enzyme [Chlorobiota bacterium]
MANKQHGVSLSDVTQIVQKVYGFLCSAAFLPGESDMNYRIEDRQANRYTLKISPPATDTALIDLQIKMAGHLTAKLPGLNFPEVVLTAEGKPWYTQTDEEGNIVTIRLLKWVPGHTLGSVNPRSPALLEKWGATCGKLSKALQDFDHPAAHRFYEWDPSQALHCEKLFGYLADKTQKKTAIYFLDIFRNETLPRLRELRQGVNYNDAHEMNLLTDENLKEPVITGIIDFGDIVFTQTVNELAIACAYAVQGIPDPLEAATYVVRGYHGEYPLGEQETAVIFPLMGARLLISVLQAARNRILHPGNEYLQVSAKPAWETLEKLKRISPALAHYTFRNTCGWIPVPELRKYDKWFAENKDRITPVINPEGKKGMRPDLSVGSTALGHFTSWQTTETLTRTIDDMLKRAGADTGVGGYGESRPFYTSDPFTVPGNNGLQWRTVHLGTDIWTAAGTPVVAPLHGKIHSFRYNRGDRNYGPAIILQHKENELTFYTLYGHLSRDSITGLQEGKIIRQGEAFARVGQPPENGNWPPHLHFQIILDMLGNKGDFPGAATPETAGVWLSLCPDSEPFAGFRNLPPPWDSLETEKIPDKRKNILGPNLSISYRHPLHIVRGQMQYLLDNKGRRYLDTVNNVAHVGHEHPRVVKAAQRQIAVLNTNTRYLHENPVRYAEELLAAFPPELSVVYFVNSGSEANELAIRMVETCTGQKDMIAIEDGYHGNTGRAISVSSYKFDRKGGLGAPSTTHVVPVPDIYRGLHRSPDTAGEQYAGYVADAVREIQNQGRNVGGFICESLLSCGGQIVLPQGYLKKAYAAVQDAGGLCIADEVQVGFGRVGEHFWGFRLQGIIPDIVTLGKPMGNGHPIGALVTTRAVADVFDNGMEYFNTYGGNPVSCAVGREVLAVIRDEGLQHHALETGNYLISCLEELKQKHPVIGDVRGHGLFLGMELVKDREQRTPATTEADYLINRMREQGILMSNDGPDENVIKIKPPMCFGRNDVNFLIDTLDKVLREDFMVY